MKALLCRLPVALTGALLLAALYVYYVLTVYRGYLLRGDEPAFVSANLGPPGEWFTRGYLDYFHIYPEWMTLNHTDLLKPVTNIAGSLNLLLFGGNYALHFATFFLAQFAGLIIFLRLLREMDVARPLSVCMAGLFLFNPAFMNAGLTCLSCHFDVLAGIFALAAFLASWRARYGFALLFLTLALFTKESAVFAPLAAALSLVLWRRPLGTSVLMLSPLVLWFAARAAAFGDATGGRISTALGQSLLGGLTVWPSGIVPDGFAAGLFSAGPQSRGDIIDAAFLLGNVALWLFVIYAAYAVVIATRTASLKSEREKLTPALLIWTLGALAFGVLLAHHSRYGGSYYPFFFLLLAGLMSPAFRVTRWVTASVLMIFAAVTIVQAGRTVRLAWAWETVIAPERALHEALRAIPPSSRVVYVINAPQGLASAPEHLRKAWALDVDVVIVNQFTGCTESSDPGAVELTPATDALRVRVPDCARLTFTNAALPGDRDMVLRQGIGTYEFPDATGAAESLELGRSMTVTLAPTSERPIFLEYNWRAAAFETFGG
jgi:hypothetical protein